MSNDCHSFTPETARHFDRYSIANAVTVKQALPCGCEPYVDVFTYRRWKAQGFQVQRGAEKSEPGRAVDGERDRRFGDQVSGGRFPPVLPILPQRHGPERIAHHAFLGRLARARPEAADRRTNTPRPPAGRRQ